MSASVEKKVDSIAKFNEAQNDVEDYAKSGGQFDQQSSALKKLKDLFSKLDLAKKDNEILIIFDSNNSFTISVELNKLLVPSPSEEVFNVNGDLVAYRQPDVGFLQGIFNSFNDAPDGFSEELKELTYSLGLEYSFNKSFFLRSGYFSEHELKGSRKFITIGTGFSTERNLKIDLSYLISTSDVISPLENTLRLSLGFNF